MRTILLTAVIAVFALPSHANAWGFDAHQFIVSRAIDMLPAPLRPFFDANRAFIVERAIDPDLWRTAGFTEEPPTIFSTSMRTDLPVQGFAPRVWTRR